MGMLDEVQFGTCQACNREGVVVTIPLGVFCNECLIWAAQIKRVTCPRCKKTLNTSDIAQHNERVHNPNGEAVNPKVIL